MFHPRLIRLAGVRVRPVGVRVAAVGAALVVLAACSSGSKAQRVVTVTVPPPGAATSASGTASGTGTASSAASTGASPSGSSTQTALPGTCDSLLPDYAVARAIGRAALTGTDAFVVGVPEKDIGRLANINCRYELTGRGAARPAGIEIGVSLYTAPARAAQRISATVADYEAHAAQSAAVTVSGLPAQLLTGGVGAGYTDPLLVLAADRRTVAVSVASTVATGSSVAGTTTKLAELALAKSAG